MSKVKCPSCGHTTKPIKKINCKICGNCRIVLLNEETPACKDCGVPTTPGAGQARCRECWKDKTGV